MEGQDMVGFLEKSLCGTRDAALNFPKEVRKFMQSQGFVVGENNSSTYWHKAKGIKVMVHRDDFVSSGSHSSLKWFKSQLEKCFEVKTKVIGEGEGEVSEARVLSKILRVSTHGWECEGDQRH